MAARPTKIRRPIPQSPAAATQEHPTLPAALRTWVELAAGTTAVNLLILSVGLLVGGEMAAQVGTQMQAVTAGAVAAMTAVPLLLSTATWALVAHRVPAFAHLWVPLAWTFGLLSLAMIIGASGVTTAITLGLMHLVTTAVAAHLVPWRLPH